jgi:hypothetical protein
MQNEEIEETENLSVIELILAPIAVTAVIIGVGGLAHIGWDLAGEGMRILKDKRSKKNQK